tara:strand:+ start:437 stop:862 length:426 start_codon:yes stop_codon:yes gene_type:complete
MSLIGGGGAGNVAGGNPSGIGSGINYVGNHAYAYSGATDVGQNAVTILRFSTGQLYIKTIFQPQYMVANAGAATEDFRFVVKFNDQEVSSMIIAEGTDRDAFYNVVNLIIPPYTKVEVTAANVTDTTTRAVGAIITGRVYA